MDLERMQGEIKAHMESQGVKQTDELMLIGALEELGEVAHALLKYRQKVMGYTTEKCLAEIADGVGDVIIYLSQLCQETGISIETSLMEAADRVLNRTYAERLAEKGLKVVADQNEQMADETDERDCGDK